MKNLSIIPCNEKIKKHNHAFQKDTGSVKTYSLAFKKRGYNDAQNL